MRTVPEHSGAEADIPDAAHRIRRVAQQEAPQLRQAVIDPISPLLLHHWFENLQSGGGEGEAP